MSSEHKVKLRLALRDFFFLFLFSFGLLGFDSCVESKLAAFMSQSRLTPEVAASTSFPSDDWPWGVKLIESINSEMRNGICSCLSALLDPFFFFFFNLSLSRKKHVKWFWTACVLGGQLSQTDFHVKV